MRALYFCDFAPKNSGGGGLLMERLLGAMPSEFLTVLSGSQHFKQVFGNKPEKKAANYIIFPVSSGTGRYGLGRLRHLADWLALPWVALLALYLIKRRQVRIILSVAH